MSGVLEHLWWSDRRGIAGAALAAPLALAEALFRMAAGLRGALYDAGLLGAAAAGVPVISIGNLAVGGAGKTPAAIAVATRLTERGRNVAVLSRGYGASRRGVRVVSDGERVLLDAEEGGDEPVLIARRVPGVRVLCGPRRAELARVAVRDLGADVLLLDDGFQHRALARDLDIVALDGANPFGNGRLLPAGPNREPPSALRRAGLVWISRVDQAEIGALARLREMALAATGRNPVESRHAPRDVLDGTLSRRFGADALRGERVLLLAGIARPAGFRRTLEAMGAEVVAERIFGDHHCFDPRDIAEALRAADAARCVLVVTTEKDAVRLPPSAISDTRLRAVRIDAEIVGGAEILDAALDAALGMPTPTPTSTPTSTSTSTPTPTPTATATPTSTPTSTPTAAAAALRGPTGAS